LVVELVFATSVSALPEPLPNSLIFSFALSYTTTWRALLYVGITATSVDILPSLRSADTPLVANEKIKLFGSGSGSALTEVANTSSTTNSKIYEFLVIGY